MSKALTEAFNAIPGDKVVSMKEMQQLSNAFYKQMSLTDQIYLNLIDRPLSVVGGVIVGSKFIGDANLRSKFQRINADGSLGYYKDEAGLYVSVATLRQTQIEAMRGLPVKEGFQQRLNEKAALALAQCTDYRPKVDAGVLKPYNFK